MREKNFRSAMHEDDQSVNQIHERIGRLETIAKKRELITQCLHADLKDEVLPVHQEQTDEDNKKTYFLTSIDTTVEYFTKGNKLHILYSECICDYTCTAGALK